MIFDRNENRPVSVLLGAGSMGTAILRRVAAGTTILFGDISEKRLAEVRTEYEGYGYAVETQIVDANCSLTCKMQNFDTQNAKKSEIQLQSVKKIPSGRKFPKGILILFKWY